MDATKENNRNEESVPGCKLRKDYPCGCCAECGWNKVEAKTRTERIWAGGLEINEKGFRYLPIHRDTGERGAGV